MLQTQRESLSLSGLTPFFLLPWQRGPTANLDPNEGQRRPRQTVSESLAEGSGQKSQNSLHTCMLHTATHVHVPVIRKSTTVTPWSTRAGVRPHVTDKWRRCADKPLLFNSLCVCMCVQGCQRLTLHLRCFTRRTL